MIKIGQMNFDFFLLFFFSFIIFCILVFLWNKIIIFLYKMYILDIGFKIYKNNDNILLNFYYRFFYFLSDYLTCE